MNKKKGAKCVYLKNCTFLLCPRILPHYLIPKPKVLTYTSTHTNCFYRTGRNRPHRTENLSRTAILLCTGNINYDFYSQKGRIFQLSYLSFKFNFLLFHQHSSRFFQLLNSFSSHFVSCFLITQCPGF